MDVSKLRLPIALVVAIIMQSSAAIWFFAQQSQTVQSLKSSLGDLTDRMSIERYVNLERDVLDNTSAIGNSVDEVDELSARLIQVINEVDAIDRRVSSVEIQIRYIGNPYTRSYSGSADPADFTDKDGM
jgi:hypothetical protein